MTSSDYRDNYDDISWTQTDVCSAVNRLANQTFKTEGHMIKESKNYRSHKKYEPYKSFKDLQIQVAKNKRVVIVGNSPSLLSNQFGKVIDSHDTVIRINKCVTKGYTKHIGQKINIWATTRNDFHNNWVPEKIHDLEQMWIRTPNTYRKLWLPDAKKIKGGWHHSGLQNTHGKNIPWATMYKNSAFESDRYFQDLTKDLEHEPCTGLLTILTATKFYKNISLVGFTFYTDDKSQNNDYEYYREKEAKKGAHPEDVIWKESKSSGFSSKKEGMKKQAILRRLVDEKSVKILNPEEIE
jgi:hypothetical protein